MAWVALAQVTVFLLVAFPGRALLRCRAFGDAAGVDWTVRRPPRWYVADAGFLLGFALVLLGALLDGLGTLAPLFGAPVALGVAGVLLAVAALGVVLWAQGTMGAAWRPDISPAAGAGLVTDGAFALVRHPNYVAMFAVVVGGALLAPSTLLLAGAALLAPALSLTARLEEERLTERHGDAYATYAARVGRFVPGVGRIGRDAARAQRTRPPLD